MNDYSQTLLNHLNDELEMMQSRIKTQELKLKTLKSNHKQMSKTRDLLLQNSDLFEKE